MKRSALIRRVALALLTAFGLLASSPTEASVSRDSSFKANPFAALPHLTSKPIAERLAAVDQNDTGCAALCELAALIDSDPLGYGTKPRPFDGGATPFGRQYQYANDNPTMYVDENGNAATDVGAAAGFVWGAGQAVGGALRRAWNGRIRNTSDYLSL